MDLPFRQIHLDFHTSPDIEQIGADFDPDDFAATLADAHVNSVTVFARCHHGLLYYPSTRFPERIHPHLQRPNLLGDQIEACHRRGIRTPIYVTVQWDVYSSREHPEWLCVDADGRQYNTRPLDAGFYKFLDVLHPGYRQFLKDHVAEIFELMPAVDGFFFDITQPKYSLAPHWIAAMDAAGADPEDPVQRQTFAERVLQEWKAEMTAFVRAQPGYTEDCSIFYNSAHPHRDNRDVLDALTHFEIESLPSGGWGYLHFPVEQRHQRNFGKTTLGMTGKFHTHWGDFHSLKNPAALEFECYQMLALGARCSIGDQLHPRGQLDPVTYDLIGNVYAAVEEREAWCRDAVPLTDMAVLKPEADDSLQEADSPGRDMPQSLMGAVRILQETRHQFDILSHHQDLSGYKLIVLPDDVRVGPSLAGKLKEFMAAGGAVLATGRSGLADDHTPLLDEWGVKEARPAEYAPNFLVPDADLLDQGTGLQATSYVMYQQGLDIAAQGSAQILAQTEAPYFNRTWRHFCSHRHTPNSGRATGPGVIRNGNVIYFAHPIFTTYYRLAPLWCRQFCGAALRLLLPDPILSIDAPSTLHASLMRQPREKRCVLHLLHYIPERRATEFDVIEDVIPLHETGVDVRTPRPIRSVRLAPVGWTLPFTRENEHISFVVPQVAGHEMVELVEE